MAESPALAALQPGTVLSSTYQVVRKIAEGGMGTVYLGQHLRLAKRLVAIKVLKQKPDPDQRTEYEQRFRREAEVCSKLNHPHIVSVTDWDTLPDGSACFVMEFLEGQSLKQRLLEGPLSREQILTVLQQLGSALEAAHRAGIIHRDLKPSNVFLVACGRADEIFVKVLDFGISKDLSAETLRIDQSVILGSPRYMSPEQARGQNERIEARSDQFSLAALAYELFANRPAFQSDTLEATMAKVARADAPPVTQFVPDLPGHIALALRRAMQREPALRFPSVQVFIEALLGKSPEALLAPGLCESATLTVPAVPQAARTPPQLAPAGQRRPLVWLTAGLVAAFGAAVLGVITLLPPGPKPAAVAPGAEPPTAPAPAVAVDAGPADPAPAPPPTADAGTRVKPAETGRSPREASLVLRPETAEILKQAEAEFAAGRYLEAIRLARKALLLQDAPGARVLLTLSHCALRDLSNARAAFYQVPDSARAEVRRRCKVLGIVW